MTGRTPELDRLQRLFNRLEAAISHHKKTTDRQGFTEAHDDALYAAHDKILKDMAKGAG